MEMEEVSSFVLLTIHMNYSCGLTIGYGIDDHGTGFRFVTVVRLNLLLFTESKPALGATQSPSGV